MKLKGHKKSLHARCQVILVGCVAAIVVYLLMGCAGGAVRPNCADDSIVAATIFNLRTGNKAYIVKSGDGRHAQAYAVVQGKHIPLHVFPLFGWYVLGSKPDDMVGGRGQTYTVDEFIRRHGPWRVK
uniref:Uncharacterized protein n=1 Tax=viral metagenome TaxID=1070528 RepID=A0A6H1ZK28_9ZZZZ